MTPRPTAETIAGRYRMLAPLGKGGMGTVWRAEDRVLRRQVAIKEVRLPDELEVDERDAMRLRALREARSAAALSHPGAVTIYDAIEHDDRVYIVMELVEADTLAQLVERDGPLPPGRAARIGLELLDAIEAAHRAGIVHRDVKPGNVMVSPERGARLTDFGIAVVADDARITRTGLVLGSPRFMAPEQASGGDVTPATDLWGLGATLYFAVEGAPPFDRGAPIPTLHAIIEEPRRAPERAGVLAPVLDALLEKDPAARPDPVRLRTMLQAACGGEAEPPRSAAPPDARAAPPDASAAPPDARVAPPDASAAPPDARAAPPDARAAPPDASAAPPDARAAPPAPPGRRRAPLLAVLVVVAAAGIVAAALWARDTGGRDRERGAGGGAPAGETPGRALPDGWSEVAVAGTGASIAHPDGWRVVEGSCNVTCIDFRDPETGTYLRLDWQSPPGADAVAAWEAQSRSFGARHAGYREIAIEAVDFKGSSNAALWEYTYSEGGADLHAYNLGVAFADYGFALNFQTRATNWAAHQHLWETFRETFEPPQGG